MIASSRSLVSWVVVFVLFATWAGCPNTAKADFHFMEISELLVGAGGDSRIQFVEFRMQTNGQTNVVSHPIHFFDAGGNELGSFDIPNRVANGSGCPGDCPRILFGTAEFAAVSSVQPDFVLPEGLLMPHGGRVSFDNANPSFAVDSIAYGIYSGDNGSRGNPAASLSASSNRSLQRTGNTGNNSADFELLEPTPTNNAGEVGTVNVPSPDCVLVDNFDDKDGNGEPDNWDRPTPGAGVDLSACFEQPDGAIVLDIGSFDVDDNKLILTTSAAPLNEDNGELAFSGLNNTVGKLVEAKSSYRVRCSLRGDPRLQQVVMGLRQHYNFDEDSNTFFGVVGGNVGLTFGWPATNGDNDHIHQDERLFCLQGGTLSGDIDYNGYGGIDQLLSNTDYTVVVDVEGDNVVNGPLTLSVKLFRKDGPEPVEYLTTMKYPGITGVVDNPDFKHGVLFAATSDGVGNVPALEISEFSVCDIPRDQLFIRCLSCSRNFDGGVDLSWQNPFDNDTSRQIAIVANDVEVGRIDGDETSYTITDPPDGELTVEVINFSGTAVTCTLCFNNPPTAVINGPAKVEFANDVATALLDGRSSDDGDDNAAPLFYDWVVIDRPEGASANIQGLGGPEITVLADMPGQYEVQLTVTDQALPDCEDPGKSDVTTHVFVAGAPEPEFRRGDVNDSGVVDISDPISLINFLFLGTAGPPACTDAGDGNDDGMVDISDIISILGFLFLGDADLAAPGPEFCGPDPSADAAPVCVYESC